MIHPDAAVPHLDQPGADSGITVPTKNKESWKYINRTSHHIGNDSCTNIFYNILQKVIIAVNTQTWLHSQLKCALNLHLICIQKDLIGI